MFGDVGDDEGAGFVLEPVDYDGHQSGVYARGRALPTEVTAAWMAAFARHCAGERPLSVLDLGSGTGIGRAHV